MRYTIYETRVFCSLSTSMCFLVTEILKWAVCNVMSTVAVVGCRHMKILLLVYSEVRVIDCVRYYQEVWRNGDIAQQIYNCFTGWG